MRGAALLAAALPVAAAKQMFVTSDSGAGDPSAWTRAGGHTGLAAGDAVCRSLAADAGLADANLYRSGSRPRPPTPTATSPDSGARRASNCGQGSLPNAGPWQRTDGVAFSHRLSDLTTTFDVLHPAYLDETGSPIQSGYDNTFTGTDANGALDDSALNCNNWQSGSSSDSALSGLLYLGAIGWTQLGYPPLRPPSAPVLLRSRNRTCAAERSGAARRVGLRHLGPRDRRPRQRPQAGGATGVAAGDAICRNLAAAGHLPAADTYVAWLSVAGAPALDRITTDGPFRRPGGVRVVASKADLTLYLPFHESDFEADELREHVNVSVVTGTDPSGQPTGDDCDGWTSADPSLTVTAGRSAASDINWTYGSALCGVPANHLLCFSNVVILFADGFESGDTAQWSAVTP